MEWVCETPGESDKQVAEAVIPALKDKSIESFIFLNFPYSENETDWWQIFRLWSSCFFC